MKFFQRTLSIFIVLFLSSCSFNTNDDPNCSRVRIIALLAKSRGQIKLDLKSELKSLIMFPTKGSDDSNWKQRYNYHCEKTDVFAKKMDVDPVAAEIELILSQIQTLSEEVAAFCHCHCDTSLSKQVCEEMNKNLEISERSKAMNEIIRFASISIISVYESRFRDPWKSDLGLSGSAVSDISKAESHFNRGDFTSVVDTLRKNLISGHLGYQPKAVSYEQIIESGKNCVCPAGKAVEFRPFRYRLRAGGSGDPGDLEIDD